MTEALFALVPVWGAPAIGLITFLSCLALPVPASLAMLAGGAFVAAGDLALAPVSGAALAGAVLGDQAGYAAGRFGGAGLWARLERRRGAGPLLARARAGLRARAAITVFLTRWLFSPLGPSVNLIAGATRLGWACFALAGLLGEAVWVALYVGLGRVFAGQITGLAATLGNLAGVLAAGAVAVLLARALWRARRRDRAAAAGRRTA